MLERDGTTAGGGPPNGDPEAVELVVLLPAPQATALAAAAGRLQLTVGALIRRAVEDFLRADPAGGFVGEVAGRPTAPLVAFEGS